MSRKREKAIVFFMCCFCCLCFDKNAFADTASETIVVQQARNEAMVIGSIQTALWLDCADKYNVYLSDYKQYTHGKKTNPALIAPAVPQIGRIGTTNIVGWADIKNYLSDGFCATESGGACSRDDGVQYVLSAHGDDIKLDIKNVPIEVAKKITQYLPVVSVNTTTGDMNMTIARFLAGASVKTIGEMGAHIQRDDKIPNEAMFFQNEATVTFGTGAFLQWINGDTTLIGLKNIERQNLDIKRLTSCFPEIK